MVGETVGADPPYKWIDGCIEASWRSEELLRSGRDYLSVALVLDENLNFNVLIAKKAAWVGSEPKHQAASITEASAELARPALIVIGIPSGALGEVRRENLAD